jgi:hypothetical protein
MMENRFERAAMRRLQRGEFSRRGSANAVYAGFIHDEFLSSAGDVAESEVHRRERAALTMNHKTLARSDEQGEYPEGVGEAPPLQRDATFLQHAIEATDAIQLTAGTEYPDPPLTGDGYFPALSIP